MIFLTHLKLTDRFIVHYPNDEYCNTTLLGFLSESLSVVVMPHFFCLTYITVY